MARFMIALAAGMFAMLTNNLALSQGNNSDLHTQIWEESGDIAPFVNQAPTIGSATQIGTVVFDVETNADGLRQDVDIVRMMGDCSTGRLYRLAMEAGGLGSQPGGSYTSWLWSVNGTDTVTGQSLPSGTWTRNLSNMNFPLIHQYVPACEDLVVATGIEGVDYDPQTTQVLTGPGFGPTPDDTHTMWVDSRVAPRVIELPIRDMSCSSDGPTVRPNLVGGVLARFDDPNFERVEGDVERQVFTVDLSGYTADQRSQIWLNLHCSTLACHLVVVDPNGQVLYPNTPGVQSKHNDPFRQLIPRLDGDVAPYGDVFNLSEVTTDSVHVWVGAAFQSSNGYEVQSDGSVCTIGRHRVSGTSRLSDLFVEIIAPGAELSGLEAIDPFGEAIVEAKVTINRQRQVNDLECTFENDQGQISLIVGRELQDRWVTDDDTTLTFQFSRLGLGAQQASLSCVARGRGTYEDRQVLEGTRITAPVNLLPATPPGAQIDEASVSLDFTADGVGSLSFTSSNTLVERFDATITCGDTFLIGPLAVTDQDHSTARRDPDVVVYALPLEGPTVRDGQACNVTIQPLFRDWKDELVTAPSAFQQVVYATPDEDGPEAMALALRLQPNPTQGPVTAVIEVLTSTLMDLQVFDGLGRQVAKVRGLVPVGASEHPLNLTDVAPGVYFVRLIVDGQPPINQRLTIVR